MHGLTPFEIAIEVAGWMAALLILSSYFLVSTGKLAPKSLAYQAMNIVGAAGFVINSGWNGAIPSAILNVMWIGIGVYTLWSSRARRT